MKCEKCDSENPDERNFCFKCGAELPQICNRCGFENPPVNKYCGKCGRKLTEKVEAGGIGPQNWGERKQLTVFFSDLSGYTEISKKLDPEEVKDLMSRIFEETSRVISKYDGHVYKFIGDAVMAIFGVPRIHEDDPIRAIKAAMEIHDMVERMNLQSEKKIGKHLSMHTGIDTGLIVVAETDLEGDAERVTGDTINLASRLTGLARAGEILVGEETHRLAEGYFNFNMLEPSKVKGWAEHIRVYKVLSKKEEPIAVHHGLTGLRADLIGRETELAQLTRMVHQLREGKKAIFSILGEAGTGKSRLVNEFKSTLDLEKTQWFEGHAYAHSQNIPYSLLTDLLSRIWQIEESDPPEKVKEIIESNVENLLGQTKDIAPYVGSLYALNYPGIESVDPEFWKNHLFKAVRTIFISLAQRAPTIVCLEDLHWADSSSLDIFRSELFNLEYPVLCLCVYRPSFTLLTSQEMSVTNNSPIGIRLQDLKSSEANDMMESLLKTKNVPEELRRFIQEKAEGNPFYLEEVINSLVELDALIRDNGGWRLTRPITRINIPPTINGVISARIDRLEKKTKRILQEASVIGRTFFYNILKKITKLKNNIDQSLSSLEMLDLIKKRSLHPELEYIFKHALTQDVAYNGLLKKERQEIHERIALVMEEIFQDRLPDFYETLAFHFKQGKSLLKAVDYLVKSGEKSLRRYAVEQSHQYYKEAFDLLADKFVRTDEKKILLIDLINKWALVFYHRGDFKGLSDLLNAHKDLAESVDDNVRLGMFYVWLGRTLWGRDKYRESYQYLRKALKLGEEIDNKQIICYACTWLTCTSADLGLLNEALVFGERALQISSSFELDHHLNYMSPAAIGYTYWIMGEKKKSHDVGKALLEFGQRQSDIRSIVLGHWVIGLSYFTDGDFTAAIECNKKALQASADPLYSQVPRLSLGMNYVLIGQFQEAELPLQQVLEYSNNFGFENLGTVARLFLGVVLVAKGHFSRGIEMIEDAKRTFQENQGRYRYAISEYVLGQVYLRIVERALPISMSMISKNIGFLVKNVLFASKKAEDHFNKAIEVLKEFGDKGLLGRAYLGLAMLHRAKHRTNQARECITKAIAYLEQCGAETYLRQAKEVMSSLKQNIN